jgi:DNA-directed RNA polymerase subunit RPC12/RpoP
MATPAAGLGTVALSGTLVVLRAKARSHPGEPQSSKVGPLSLAWRLDVLESKHEVELLAIRREDGRPIPDQALLAMMAAIPEELVPVRRKPGRGGLMFTLEAKGGCVRCGWPVDPAAKVRAERGGRCSVCLRRGLTRCRKCGKEIPDEPAYAWMHCTTCGIQVGQSPEPELERVLINGERVPLSFQQKAGIFVVTIGESRISAGSAEEAIKKARDFVAAGGAAR